MRKIHFSPFLKKFCHKGGVRGGYSAPPHDLPYRPKQASNMLHWASEKLYTITGQRLGGTSVIPMKTQSMAT